MFLEGVEDHLSHLILVCSHRLRSVFLHLLTHLIFGVHSDGFEFNLGPIDLNHLLLRFEFARIVYNFHLEIIFRDGWTTFSSFDDSTFDGESPRSRGDISAQCRFVFRQDDYRLIVYIPHDKSMFGGQFQRGFRVLLDDRLWFS